MQYDVPQLTTKYVTASVNSSMTLIVVPKLMTTSEALRAYSATERKCYFSDERSLKYFLQYTQPNCEIECEADFVLKKCGCLMMFVEGKTSF
jgi:acid-sensing ion channel, other